MQDAGNNAQLCLSNEFDFNPGLNPSNESDQWYTPPSLILRVKECFDGTIDLDPASCEVANRTVGAKHFYTEQQDGLIQDWFGKVFCNPPYSSPLIGNFTQKGVNEFLTGKTQETIFLLKEGPTNTWFKALRPFLTCYLDSRVRFVDGLTGKICDSPRSGHCLVYLGHDPYKFIKVMSRGNFGYFPNIQFNEACY